MIDSMGIFRTTIGVARAALPDARHDLHGVMVDSGSEYSWIPRPELKALGIATERVDRFRTADARVIQCDSGLAILSASNLSAATIVVFGEDGDSVLLGAHGLERLNCRIDLVTRELVPAGPVPAATSRGA